MARRGAVNVYHGMLYFESYAFFIAEESINMNECIRKS